MKQQSESWSVEGPVPFSGDPDAFYRHASQVIDFQAMALGIIDTRLLKPDCFLFLNGVSNRDLNRWCDGRPRQDTMLNEARRKGISLGKSTRSSPSTPLPALTHSMVLMKPLSSTSRQFWYLAVGRKSGRFDTLEQQAASLLLNTIQASFDCITEPDMGRLIIGSDGRLIHADPGIMMRFLHKPNYFKELSEILMPVIHQRWPAIADHAAHDLALSISDNPIWIRFRQGPKLDTSELVNWYIELRPLAEDDLPPIGLVSDPRVSGALAYLSDHYAQSPSLPKVARHVHTSPFHFHRLFSKQVGISPKHYVLRMQLQIAKWLLRSSRLPIGRIADKTGFASHGHFTATFHRTVGCSPTHYRSPK